ncbi:putative multidrug resistance protein fnx1 [Podospora australis]|uniref:Multidrug resistance protein fnx1 n=1 Tax=Podospora australis TaxID=1536484 RepID=A0AAN6WLH9_9PEZI|nr:putative multidrug resistance protein fnx1 [Podospora australis]
MAADEHQRHVGSTDERTALLQRQSLTIQPDVVSQATSRSTEPHNEGGRSESRDGEVSPTSTVGSHQSRDNGQWKKNLVLLLGVFLVNSDSAILLAMFRQIASEFDELSSASWVINAYVIGIIAAQPLYGKLSDIYGRKPLLLLGYLCYCVGGLVAGTGLSFWSLLLGRTLCGIGNAGVTVLISTLIVDLVPMREVAVWRGYVYAINQIGRALGPSLGGFIAEATNWRWALLYHVPINFLGMIFIWWKMSFPFPPGPNTKSDNAGPGASRFSKFNRIDFSGSTTLAIANVALLLFLDRLQKSFGDFGHDTQALVSLSIWLGFTIVFLLVEGFWAREPVFPLRLLRKRNVVSAYVIQFLLTAAQVALYTSVPLYFRVSVGDTTTTSSIRLLFMTLGTVAGSLFSGFFIKRTGLYRLIIIVSTTLSTLSFVAILFRWRDHTGWAETLYGFPIGVGFGVSLSAAFIALTSGLEAFQVAVATSGFYLSMNLGSLIGVSGASLLISTYVERRLQNSLPEMPEKGQIIHDVLSSIDNIDKLPKKLADLVLAAYSKSFINVWGLCLSFALAALVTTFLMREGQIASSRPENKRPSASQRHGYGTVSDEEDSDRA